VGLIQRAYVLSTPSYVLGCDCGGGLGRRWISRAAVRSLWPGVSRIGLEYARALIRGRMLGPYSTGLLRAFWA